VVTAKSADGKFEKTFETPLPHAGHDLLATEKMAYGAAEQDLVRRDTTLQPFQFTDETYEFELHFETRTG